MRSLYQLITTIVIGLTAVVVLVAGGVSEPIAAGVGGMIGFIMGLMAHRLAE